MPQELREYQRSLVERVICAYDNGARRICLVSPTGSGKTIVAAELIKQFVGSGLKVMFQVNLDCLIGQTRAKLWDMGYRDKSHTGYIKAQIKELRSAPLQIASQQTLLRRDWWKERSFDVIFFDECHTTAFGEAAAETRRTFPNALYIGLTATPMRMKKNEGLRDHFDECIAAPVPRELTASGYLAPMDYYSLPSDFIDLSRVRLTSTGQEFNIEDLGVACNHPQSIDRCFEEYHNHGQNQPALIFAVTVDHAKTLAERFNRGGVLTEIVTAKTPSRERSMLYSAFKKGEIQAIASVNCISTGFDVPNATVGIVARPTKSEGLWYQIVGRLMRPAPGKVKGIILDIAGNTWRFGIPDYIEKYELDFSQLDGSGDPPFKTCENCGLLNLISVKFCKNCGEEFPIIKREPVTKPLILIHEGEVPVIEYIKQLEQELEQVAKDLGEKKQSIDEQIEQIGEKMKQIDKEKQSIDEQIQVIDEQIKLINKEKQSIDEQIQVIDESREQRNKQRAYVSDQWEEVTRKWRKSDQKQLLWTQGEQLGLLWQQLGDQIRQIEEQTKQIWQKMEQVEKQRKEMMKQKKQLEEQKKKIKKQRENFIVQMEQLNKQKKQLEEQLQQINEQRNQKQIQIQIQEKVSQETEIQPALEKSVCSSQECHIEKTRSQLGNSQFVVLIPKSGIKLS